MKSCTGNLPPVQVFVLLVVSLLIASCHCFSTLSTTTGNFGLSRSQSSGVLFKQTLKKRQHVVGFQQSRSFRRFLSDFDFPSAMPEKPQLTLQQKMEQSADEFIENMTNALGEGVEAPPELDELKQLRQESTDPSTLALKIYQLMIERGMRYDEAPETGTLTPTEFNIRDNLQIKEVRDEFGHLYRYGMLLMDRGLLTADQVKETVLERLIKRTGLSPEEFDTWLGY